MNQLLSDAVASHLTLTELVNRSTGATHSCGTSRARRISPGYLLVWEEGPKGPLLPELADGDEGVIQMVVELHCRYS